LKKGFKIIPLILLILIVFNWSKLKLVYRYYLAPCYYNYPVKQSDFPQVFLEVDLQEYYQELQKLANPYFKIDTVAKISYNKQEFPILQLSNKESLNPRKLLILAGVHGNESGGTLAVLGLLKEYHKNPSRFNDWYLRIVTPVNPAGTVAMSRYNECGCDLNRKVKTSSQKGIVIQRQIVDAFKPDAIISMHEAPSSDFLIHSNEYLEDDLLFQILKETENQGVSLAKKDYLGQNLEIAGNSKIKGHLKFFKNIMQVQAIGDYASEREIIDITTESGWNSQDSIQRINSHVYSILSFVDNFRK